MSPTIYKSTFPPLAPPAKVGVFEFLFVDNPNIDLDAIAVVDVGIGKSLSYRSLIRDCLRFAAGLSSSLTGLQPGDSILIFSPNSLLYPVLTLAGQAAGLIVSTANSSYTPDELKHQLVTSRAKVLLVGGDLVKVAREGAKLAGLKDDVIYVMPDMEGKTKVERGLKSVERLRGKDGFKPVKFPADKLDKTIAYLPFSSGTTGLAKGVAITQSNMTASVQQLDATGMINKENGSIVMGCLPLYHIFGLVVLLHNTLYLGGKIVLLPKFDMVAYLKAAQEHEATLALIVPPIALGLARHPIVDKFDLSSLRFVVSGAAPMSWELQSALQARINGQRKPGVEGETKVIQGWGMTETTSGGLLPDVRDGPVKTLTVGKLLPGMEARLVDEDGKDVPEGEPGEFLIRGPLVMLGYYGNEKATKETIGEDGWMSTGDVAVRTPGGDFSIVDRRKELIKYKGFQVPPAELEAILLGCPLVADAAVIGIYDDNQATELPRAYIVPNPANAKDADLPKKVADYVASKVAPHKRLRGGVTVIEEIPKSPSGKILRKDLRAKAAQEGKPKPSKL